MNKEEFASAIYNARNISEIARIVDENEDLLSYNLVLHSNVVHVIYYEYVSKNYDLQISEEEFMEILDSAKISPYFWYSHDIDCSRYYIRDKVILRKYDYGEIR